MGLIEKIFGTSSSRAEDKIRFHRQVRVSLYHSDIHFKPLYEGIIDEANVVNISMGGMALEMYEGTEWPAVGDVLPGQLVFDENKIDLSCKIIHKHGGLIGCEFLETPLNFHKTLEDYLRFEFAGKQLIKVKPDVMKEVAQGAPYYFFGKGNNELYFVIDRGKVLLFNIIVFGRILAGGEDKMFTSGKVNIDMTSKVHGYKRVDPVIWDSEVPGDLVADALKFVANIEVINEDHRQSLLQLLEKSI